MFWPWVELFSEGLGQHTTESENWGEQRRREVLERDRAEAEQRRMEAQRTVVRKSVPSLSLSFSSSFHPFSHYLSLSLPPSLYAPPPSPLSVFISLSLALFLSVPPSLSTL